MARIKLLMPERFSFSMPIEVRITDLNYGGHLGNDKLLSMIHEARVAFIRHLGFEGEMNIGGEGIILADVAIVYRSEAFYGDTLKIEVGVGEFHTYGLDFFYKVTHNSSGKEVALAKTGIVFFNYAQRKITPFPDSVKKKFEG